jgi:excisionase family DNA binding protein
LDTSEGEHTDLLSLAQAAKLVGVHPTALLRRVKAGRLRHVRVGRSYATTLRWIAESEEPGAMGRPPKKLPENMRPKG